MAITWAPKERGRAGALGVAPHGAAGARRRRGRRPRYGAAGGRGAQGAQSRGEGPVEGYGWGKCYLDDLRWLRDHIITVRIL